MQRTSPPYYLFGILVWIDYLKERNYGLLLQRHLALLACLTTFLTTFSALTVLASMHLYFRNSNPCWVLVRGIISVKRAADRTNDGVLWIITRNNLVLKQNIPFLFIIYIKNHFGSFSNTSIEFKSNIWHEVPIQS